MKSFTIRILAIVLAMFMSCGLFFACGGKKAPTAESGEKVLKIGVLGPMTGPDAWFGDDIKAAIDMRFSPINYRIGEYKIELVWIDSESDTEKAAIAYEKAITKDGIDLGFMNWCSWVSVACMDIAAKYKIPHFFSFGTEQAVDDKVKANFETYKYWVGKAWPSSGLLTQAYVDTLEVADWEPRNKNFAVVCDESGWGRDFGAAIAKRFEDAGWTKVSEDWIPYGETDFAPLLGKLKAADVSLVCGTITDPASVSSYVKQARDAGLKAVLITDGLGWDGEWYSKTGEASDYVFDQSQLWTTPEALDFSEKFKKERGFAPSPAGAGMCYDWTGYLISVLEKTLEEYGEITSKTLMQCAEKWVISGKMSYTDGIIHNEYKYTPETFPDPVVDKDHYIFPVIQYFNGEGKIVWPKEWATQDPVIPDFMR
jgi:branched-chain amino acid transport system substrate-binding protein